MRILVLIALVFFAGIRGAPAQEILLRVQDTHGNVVCNNGGSWRPIPNFPGLYIGRVIGTPAPTWCAGVNQPVLHYTTLGIYTLDIPHKTLTLQYELTAPPTTFNGWYIRTIYDAQTMVLGGQVWATAECTAHTADGVEHVSACTFPLIADQYGNPQIDAAHFSVPVLGDTYNGKLASSASTPAIVNWNGTPYLYWTIDNQGVTPAITRGAELVLTNGLLSVVGSGGTPISALDDNLAWTVYDVEYQDPLYGWVASVRSFYPAPNGAGFYIVSTMGGVYNGTKCLAPNTAGVSGCWRTEVTFSSSPLGYNVFAQNPQPVDMIPGQPLDYPASFTDPNTGTRYLATGVALPVNTYPGYAPAAPATAAGNTVLLPWPADLP